MPNVCQVPFSFTVPAGGNANSLHHTAALQEIFLTSLLSSLLQMTPAQERTARHLKALTENMKIILGSNGVRNSVFFLLFLFSVAHTACFSAAEGEEKAEQME